jgi:hypothetical protein
MKLAELAGALCLATSATLMSDCIAWSATPQEDCTPKFMDCVSKCSEKFSPNTNWSALERCVEEKCFPPNAKCQNKGR